MKTLIKKILKAVPAKRSQQLFQQDKNRSKSTAFEPAPAYWALIPVRVESIITSARKPDN